MAYTDVFGGELIFPSLTSYNAITTAVDVTLQWPREQQIEGVNVVADWMDIDATVVSLNIDMPSAQQASTGNKATFNNIGSNTFTVRDSTGGTIQSVAPGEQWVLVLTDNSTAAGTWITSQLGATVSVASAGALAGAGIKAITTTLNQMIDSDVEASTPFTVVDGDRAKCSIYTAGAGTCNLPTPGTVGNDWFFMLRNSGSGTLNVVPPSGQIDGGASLNLDPNDSCFIFTDGTDFFTVGLSTGSTIAFDFVSIAVPGSGDFVLSGANLNRISYRFTGALTGNRRIVVPNTTQQYWVDNQTSGAFDLEIDTSGGAGQTIPQGQSLIVYCDATDVINATSSTSVAFPITVGQGGTGATTAGGAQTNLQVPPTSRQINTTAPLAGGGDLSANRTLTVGAATEGASGVAEIATQTETDTGTDDARIVTPLKLATYSGPGSVQGAVRSVSETKTTDTTLADDAVLSGFPLEPSAQYIVEVLAIFDGNGTSTGGFQWGFDFNGQIANVETNFGRANSHQQTNGVETLRSYTAATSGNKAPLDSNTVDETLHIIMGVVTQSDYVSGTAIDFQWAQQVSSGSTRMFEGSNMKVTRVA